MKKKISIVLIVLAVALAAYPIYKELNTKQLQEQLQSEVVIEPSQVPDKPAKKKVKYSKDKKIGSITIPKIKLDLPIIVGAYEPNLGLGACWMPGTGKFGDIGNAALACHKGYYKGRLFSRIHELKSGDTFTVKMKDDEIYDYKVVNKKIVEPTEISVLDQPKDREIVTLITCTSVYPDAKRWIIVAERVKSLLDNPIENNID